MGGDLTGSLEGFPERFVPDRMRGRIVEAEHLCRYVWAAPAARGRRVLDAGCGMGYGSRMLAEAGAASVLGIDIAEEVIAAIRPGAPAGVGFEVGDLARLPIPDASFDLVVCFEAIEHVRDPEPVLDGLCRVLAP